MVPASCFSLKAPGSMDGRLKSFKSGAFRASLDSGIPILPVTLLGTQKILPSKTLRVFPGRARMVIHPAIEAWRQDTGRDYASNTRCHYFRLAR